jgi:hypothetical protein
MHCCSHLINSYDMYIYISYRLKSKFQPFLYNIYIFGFELILLCFEGLYLVLSLVPNHSSKKHPWFVKSERNDTQYRDYYIWSSGSTIYDLEDHTPKPPNNWVCKKHYTKL